MLVHANTVVLHINNSKFNITLASIIGELFKIMKVTIHDRKRKDKGMGK